MEARLAPTVQDAKSKLMLAISIKKALLPWLPRQKSLELFCISKF